MNRSWGGFDTEDYFRASQIAMGLLDEDLDADLDNEQLPENGHRIKGTVDDNGVQRVARELSEEEKKMKAELEGKTVDDHELEEYERQAHCFQVLSGSLLPLGGEPLMRVTPKHIGFISPAKFMHIPELVERLNYIREYRLKSPVDRIQKTADTPYLFTQNRQPKTDYIIIPRVSSERRNYIPIGFLSATVIVSDSAVIVNNAGLYDFGILCSYVHNAWMRTVAGRLENRYRYAPSVYYNFPFPDVSNEQRKTIENSAQAILEARKLYPKNCLAEMYGEEMYMFPELLKAHQANDRAVMTAYGMPIKETDEAACVAWLMRLYQEKINSETKQ